MALSTLSSDAHEYLSHVLSSFQGITLYLIVVGCWIAERTTGGSQQFPHHLIQRNVPGEVICKPLVVKEGRLVTHLIRTLNHEQLCKLHRPDFTELFSCQELFDECCTLISCGIRHESLVVFLGGELPGNVDRAPTQEFLIRA